MQQTDLQLLLDLLAIDSPVGDEGTMADWLTDYVEQNHGLDEPDGEVPRLTVKRLRDCVVATKGSPRVAIFCHIDTNGFTVGYDQELIAIGAPDVAAGDLMRQIGIKDGIVGTLTEVGEDEWEARGLDLEPGRRLVFARKPTVSQDVIEGPYLDNRAGLWATLKALQTLDSFAVAFTTGEETGGSGAAICARYLYDTFRITLALIADITWHTDDVHCGSGVAISRRDRWVPSQWLVDQVLRLAEKSGVPFQVEIESSGGSDGAGIERSGCPIDWIFVGAPQKRPHSATESLALNDLEAMAQMLGYLCRELSTR
jgi:putative aminopeptidase FrvX